MYLRGSKVLILGADGYLGRALAFYLKNEGCKLKLIDNFSRRDFVQYVNSVSLFPLPSRYSDVEFGDAVVYDDIVKACKQLDPDVIVHFAEQPSAPFSMKCPGRAANTQSNNIVSTLNVLWAMKECCPDAHLIKLGTMGEYGDTIYNGTSIPEEHRISVSYKERMISIPTPRFTGSFYHFSKIFDSLNIEFACNIWGLRCTDINQGPVYGTRVDGMEKPETRFDYDSYFGTVVNRFVVQAVIDHPLTVYGRGGQTRGYINLNDAVRAIGLIAQNPPDKGQIRVVNQITEVFSVNEIASMVSEIYGCRVGSVENPRQELEDHDYLPVHEKLKHLGLTEYSKMIDKLPEMLSDVESRRDYILPEVISPQTSWRKS